MERVKNLIDVGSVSHWILEMTFFIKLGVSDQHSRLRRPISKIRMILLMDTNIWIISLKIMFAVRPICAQDAIFKMSSVSPADTVFQRPARHFKAMNTRRLSLEFIYHEFNKYLLKASDILNLT